MTTKIGSVSQKFTGASWLFSAVAFLVGGVLGTAFGVALGFFLFPFVGAILGVVFHEFVFKKTQEALGTSNDDSLLD